jgi:hypothetical protein
MFFWTDPAHKQSSGFGYGFSQAAKPSGCSYQVTPQTFSFDAGGQTNTDIQFSVGQSGCTWTAYANAFDSNGMPSSWFSWLTPTGGTGPGTFVASFRVDLNLGYKHRKLDIYVAGQKMDITQEGAAGSCTVNVLTSEPVLFPMQGFAPPFDVEIINSTDSSCLFTIGGSDVITTYDNALAQPNSRITKTLNLFARKTRVCSAQTFQLRAQTHFTDPAGAGIYRDRWISITQAGYPEIGGICIPDVLLKAEPPKAKKFYIKTKSAVMGVRG